MNARQFEKAPPTTVVKLGTIISLISQLVKKGAGENASFV